MLIVCCGYGGLYNFNVSLFCIYLGIMNGGMVNLFYFCLNFILYINWDGIYFIVQMNWIMVMLFLNGMYIIFVGGFNCSVDISNWYLFYDFLQLVFCIDEVFEELLNQYNFSNSFVKFDGFCVN